MRAQPGGMRRRVPIVLAATLAVMWLLLNKTLALGNVLLAIVLGVALAWASGVLRPLQPQLQRWQLAAVLLGLVLRDIVRSNFAVARIVLGGARGVRSGFVKIPLELTDPHGLAVLAGIVTATPGTVWVDHDLATST